MQEYDYSNITTIPAVPEASSMIETFRAIGYNVETAVADIIDNSISAGGKNIWIDFEWKGSNTWLSIKDDGCGMNNEELVQAMRPGSKNPLAQRNSSDLGRFGLGLKTASFSQARKLTVITKKTSHATIYWTWDLDYVSQTGQWNLIDYLPNNFSTSSLDNLNSGTIIVWNDIDRIVKNFREDDRTALDKFLSVMEQVKKHLSIVFHRYIESKRINIFFQNHEIKSWNPFLVAETATQSFPEEPLHNGEVIVKGYILPHKSKIDEETYKNAEGIRGWNEHQGFYVYRNDRLLLAGDWLGMFRKEEHYKLVRIQIDLPNNLDADWQIDIKKSVARPPLLYRDQIKAYATNVRSQGVEVYRHKGKTIERRNGYEFQPLWMPKKRGDKWSFVVNRQHMMLEEFRKMAVEEPAKAIERLLRFVEETIPAKSIFIKESEEPDLQLKPFENTDQEPVRKAMQMMYNNMVANGKASEQAKSIIANMEPFNHYVHFLEFLNQ